MKIRIISEKKISPLSMQFPLQHPDFFNIRQPPTNVTKTNDDMLSVFIHYEAYQKLWEHVRLDFHNELGGAMLGYYGSDNGNEFIVVTDVFNQPPEYFSTPTMLRFTGQFYDDLEEYVTQIEAQYPNILRLGLYHTHPNYGVFLSKTDAKTFKGIFKDPFQIAMVVDPVREEDGVFFWIGSELSRRTGYRIFHTDDTKFALHTAKTRNPLAAKYNTQLQLDTKNQIIPKIQVFESQVTDDLQKKPQRIDIQSHSSDEPTRITIEKTTHRIDKPLYIPRVCPLYDMHYRNREFRLYRYFVPLQKSPELESFPYEIFIHRNVENQLTLALEQKQQVLGFLRGNLHYDKLQKLYFVDAYEAVITEPTTDLLPFNSIAHAIEEQRKKGITNILGWFFASHKPYLDVFRFTTMHQKLFDKNHHFGIVLRTKALEEQKDESAKTVLDVENAYIVAYNFDKNIPYDYFRNLFLYEKPY
ncbi:MAG: Mov34/MPN/PAD-1 family protein [Chitinophagales bacterium]